MGLDPVTAGIITVGSVLSAREGKKGAEKAAESQQQAADEAAQVQREAQQSFVERTEPFREAGTQAISPLVQAVLSDTGQAPGLPGAEILQNPLLQAIQGDVTRRVFANQASRGQLGGAETAVALQNALAPTALNLGLGLQDRETAARQRQASNLFDLLRLGSNVAAGQGTAGLTSAAGIGQALQSGGAAQAAGQLGASQAVSQGIGDLTGLLGFGFGGGFNRPLPPQNFTGELFGGAGGFRPTISSQQAAGPLLPSGRF